MKMLENETGRFFVDEKGRLERYEPSFRSQMNESRHLLLLALPEGVRALPSGMFYNDFNSYKITEELTFPRSLVCIGVGCGEGNVFNRSQLPDVWLPEKLETLGDYSFAHSTISSVTITGASEWLQLGICRQFKDSRVGMIRVPMKYREVLEADCIKRYWSDSFEMTDPVLGQLYCEKNRWDAPGPGESISLVLEGIAGKEGEGENG